jgi:hypothetical protein
VRRGRGAGAGGGKSQQAFKGPGICLYGVARACMHVSQPVACVESAHRNRRRPETHPTPLRAAAYGSMAITEAHSLLDAGELSWRYDAFSEVDGRAWPRNANGRNPSIKSRKGWRADTPWATDARRCFPPPIPPTLLPRARGPSACHRHLLTGVAGYE